MRCTVKGEEPVNASDAPVPNSDKLQDGQHVDHWVMCPTEIIREGFKRPVRTSYRHVGIPGPAFPLRELTAEERERWGGEYVKYEPYPEDYRGSALGHLWTQEELDKIDKGCGGTTSMPKQIAETYAASPGYYGSTFCCHCGDYFKVGRDGEFVWAGTGDRVGT